MKKLALALVASAVALSATNANTLGTGFYAGLHTGFGAVTAKATGKINNVAQAQGSFDVGNTAANIGLMAGYGVVQNCLYFGGEAAYTFENHKITDSLGTTALLGSSQLKRNGYFEVAVRGGYIVAPSTMLYVRLGARWGKWSLNDSLNNGFTNAAPASGSKNRVSFAPGLGLETAVHKNVYLRVEYTYEFGPSVRATRTNNNGFSNLGTIRTQSGKIGLAYKF